MFGSACGLQVTRAGMSSSTRNTGENATKFLLLQAARHKPRTYTPGPFTIIAPKKSLRKKRDGATLMIEIEKRESDSEKDHSSLNIADESRRFVNENLEFACPPVV